MLFLFNMQTKGGRLDRGKPYVRFYWTMFMVCAALSSLISTCAPCKEVEDGYLVKSGVGHKAKSDIPSKISSQKTDDIFAELIGLRERIKTLKAIETVSGITRLVARITASSYQSSEMFYSRGLGSVRVKHLPIAGIIYDHMIFDESATLSAPSMQAIEDIPEPITVFGLPEMIKERDMRITRSGGGLIAEVRNQRNPSKKPLIRIKFNESKLPDNIDTFSSDGILLENVKIVWLQTEGEWFPAEVQNSQIYGPEIHQTTTRFTNLLINPALSPTIFGNQR